jgi:hypothetical protein
VRRHAVSPTVVVAGMLVLAVATRIWLTRKVAAPWIMSDELEYSDLARSFESTGHYLVRGAPSSVSSIYPILIAPAWAFGSIKTAYEIAKTENVLMMTAGAIPFYLWGRRLVPPWYAVTGTGLLLLIPSFAYTGTLMTENAAFPAFLLAIFLIALALERPTLPFQLGALAAIALASAVRIQALIFLLIFPTAVLLKVLFAAAGEGRLRRGRLVFAEIRRYWFTLAALAVALIAYVIYKAAEGGSLRSGLGSYEITLEVHYSIRDAARWILYHFGEIAFSVGILPASALVVLFALSWRRGLVPRAAEQAFVAVAVATTLWVVIQAGAFASRFSLRIEERSMFYVAPVLLLAFVVWLAKGSPRPAGATAVAVVLPAALLLTIPIESLLGYSYDAFGFLPLLRLSERLNGGATEVRTLLGLGALAAGLLFALVPRRAAIIVLPLTVAVFLGLSSNTVIGKTNGQALAARNDPAVADPSWVDDTIGRAAGVGFLLSADFSSDPHPVWQTEFWNRSIRGVYNFGATDSGLPSIGTTLDPATGRIAISGSEASGRTPDYFVVDSKLHLAGRLITQQGPLALYRVAQPLRLIDFLSGVYPDGWMGSTATYDRYDVPRHGRSWIDVELSRRGVVGPRPARVTIAVGPLKVVNGLQTMGKVTARQVRTIHNGAETSFRLPVPRRPFRVDVSVAPTFAPSEFGSADTRQLGSRVTFRLRHA